MSELGRTFLVALGAIIVKSVFVFIFNAFLFLAWGKLKNYEWKKIIRLWFYGTILMISASYVFYLLISRKLFLF